MPRDLRLAGSPGPATSRPSPRLGGAGAGGSPENLLETRVLGNWRHPLLTLFSRGRWMDEGFLRGFCFFKKQQNYNLGGGLLSG